jgi:hypothetical protein
LKFDIINYKKFNGNNVKGIYSLILICLSITFPFDSFSQYSSLKSVDSFAISVGKGDSLTIQQISYLLTEKYTNPILKSRAIFTWIAHNIAYDCQAFHTISKRKEKPEDVFELRKAVCAGYSNLFMEMCSYAGLRCLTVDGYARNGTETIGEEMIEPNHSWNVVLIENEWKVIDVTWASGYTDKKVKNFTPQFSETYFFPDQKKFLFNHFPNLDTWKPTKSKLSKAEFWKIPTVLEGFFIFDINDFLPKNGIIRAKTKNSLSFSFNIQSGIEISTIDIVVGEDKKEKLIKPTFNLENGKVTFSLDFPTSGSFPMTIYIDKVPSLKYQLEIE